MRRTILLLLSMIAINMAAQTNERQINVTENTPYRTDVGTNTVIDPASPLFGPQTDRPAIQIIHGGRSAGTKNFQQDSLWINNGQRRIFGLLNHPKQPKGEMPLAIISHGFNGTYHFGKNYFEALAQMGYQTFTFDFPCGSVNSRSDANTMNMSMLDEKSDLLAIIDYFRRQPSVDASRIVLIGESQGGLVTALAAAEKPSRVSKVVLVYPAFCIPDNWRKRYPEGVAIPDTTLLWNVPLGRRFFEEVRPMQVFDKIAAYRRPVLIVQGNKDAVVSMDDTRRAVSLYKDARLHVIPGAGHGFKPHELQEAIRQITTFLQR